MASITTKTTSAFDWAHFNRTALKVSDEITDTLKTGEEVTFVVMDDGVMGLKNCLADTHRMNDDYTNKGGWAKSEMRRYLNEDVFDSLPDDLQAIIKTRNIGSSKDKLWLFSEAEIFGEHDWTEKAPDRGEQLEYFKTPANRVKTDCDGDPCWWWERAPGSSNATYFCGVDSGGDAGVNGASVSSGVCFGFYF